MKRQSKTRTERNETTRNDQDPCTGRKNKKMPNFSMTKEEALKSKGDEEERQRLAAEAQAEREEKETLRPAEVGGGSSRNFGLPKLDEEMKKMKWQAEVQAVRRALGVDRRKKGVDLRGEDVGRLRKEVSRWTTARMKAEYSERKKEARRMAAEDSERQTEMEKEARRMAAAETRRMAAEDCERERKCREEERKFWEMGIDVRMTYFTIRVPRKDEEGGTGEDAACRSRSAEVCAPAG